MLTLLFLTLIPTGLVAEDQRPYVFNPLPEYEEPAVHSTNPNRVAGTTNFDSLISYYAQLYGVSEWTMHHIISRESQYVSNARGDQHIICQRTGKPVNARGLAQITSCYYPEVTDQQADDPNFAIDFLARHLAEGKCSRWSTCPRA